MIGKRRSGRGMLLPEEGTGRMADQAKKGRIEYKIGPGPPFAPTSKEKPPKL